LGKNFHYANANNVNNDGDVLYTVCYCRTCSRRCPQGNIIYSKLMNNHQRVQMETDCLSGRIQGGDLPP